MEMHICPIVLYNKKLIPCKFQLSDNISIRRITSEEKRKMFGIISIKWCKNVERFVGWISICKMETCEKPSPILSASKAETSFESPFIKDMICAEYVIEIGKDAIYKDSDNINVCFSLLCPTSTGIYLGFSLPENISKGTIPEGQRRRIGGISRGTKCNPFSGKYDYSNWTKSDLESIKDIYETLCKSKNREVLKQLSEQYLLAISSNVNLEVGFLLLTTCLEMIYLKDNNSEITFRLSAYISKIIYKNKKFLIKKGLFRFDKKITAIEIFNLTKTIYEIRSKIIHSGKSKTKKGTAENHFPELTEIVRLSILLFMYDSDSFSKENLEQILINGN